MISHLTGSQPKNGIVSDFSGDISISLFFAMFCKVNTPLCKLSPESATMTRSSAKVDYLFFIG
jgi:hypothetical protein